MRIVFFILSITFPLLAMGQYAHIRGIVTDENNRPIESVNISIPFTSIGSTTGKNGSFSLEVPANKEVSINISFVGYVPFDTTLVLQANETAMINKKLTIDYSEIEEVWIRSANRGTNLTRIEIKDFNVLPNASGGIETLLKTMPGVSANNELSSQYSVRGGNFDENLVYVNDVEIYRPLLIRSGQQEGLSFVNPDLVQSVDFSAGGFEARYGDKMSSVLDIKYRKPTNTAGSVSASMVGGTAHLEGATPSGRFTHISGFRYKTTTYLLNSLDVSGDYKPNFYDFQSYLTYKANNKFEFSLLGNVSVNHYFLKPDEELVEFGTFQKTLNLMVYYEGQEVDRFNTLTGAFTTKFMPKAGHTFSFILSGFNTLESETFDIIGRYSINELDNQAGSETAGDSIASFGVGGFHKHARNNLDAQVYSAYLRGNHVLESNTLDWGLKLQYETVDDEINEWEIVDSLGYSIPYYGNKVSTYRRIVSDNTLHTYRVSAHLQNTKPFESSNGEWYLTYGARSSYWTYNKQLLFSPRILVNYIPYWNTRFNFFASTGYYHQPPFYKEFRNVEGQLNKFILAQKSIHFIVGSDYNFMAWNRPFVFTSELYYKILENLVPYKIENIRLQYMGKNKSNGYAAGMEFKISGEFVKDAQSWASLSFLSTKEDIEGDYKIDSNNVREYIGYIPRLTNQFINFSTFFQDYFPNNPGYKFHLTFFFGSKLPVTNPYSKRYDIHYKMRSYKRVDIGLSKSLKKDTGSGLFKSIWLNVEALNLFGFRNVSSYNWIKTIRTVDTPSGQFGVPNFLTGRRLNVKITAKF
jgi:hypothetical protein